MLLKVRKPAFEFSNKWTDIIRELGKMKGKIKDATALQELPPKGWVKYNTNRVVREEEGESPYAFCLRDMMKIYYMLNKSHISMQKVCKQRLMLFYMQLCTVNTQSIPK